MHPNYGLAIIFVGPRSLSSLTYPMGRVRERERTERITVMSLICNQFSLLVQKCTASNETSGIDIVVQIILLMEFTDLEDHQDEAMKLKSSAIKTLLAVIESHQDSNIIDRILIKIGSPDQLVRKYCMYACIYLDAL